MYIRTGKFGKLSQSSAIISNGCLKLIGWQIRFRTVCVLFFIVISTGSFFSQMFRWIAFNFVLKIYRTPEWNFNQRVSLVLTCIYSQNFANQQLTEILFKTMTDKIYLLQMTIKDRQEMSFSKRQKFKNSYLIVIINKCFNFDEMAKKIVQVSRTLRCKEIPIFKMTMNLVT